MNEENIYRVILKDKNGRPYVKDYTQDEYESTAAAQLSQNYTPDQYDVVNLRTSAPENVEAGKDYLVSLPDGQSQYFTGDALLGGSMAQINERFGGNWKIHSAEAMAKPSSAPQTPEGMKAWASSVSKQVQTAMDNVNTPPSTIADMFNQFNNQSWTPVTASDNIKAEARNDLAIEAAHSVGSMSDEDYNTYQEKKEEQRQARADYLQEVGEYRDYNSIDAQITAMKANGQLDFIKECETNLKKMLDEASAQGMSPDEVIDNYTQLKTQYDELVAKKTSHPYYQRQMDQVAELNSELQTLVEPHKSAIMMKDNIHSNTAWSQINRQQMEEKAKSMGYDNLTSDNYAEVEKALAKEKNEWYAVDYFAGQTQRVLDAPDLNDDSIKSFYKGTKDTFTDEDFWTMGLQSIVSNVAVKQEIDNIREKLQRNINQTDLAKALDSDLTDSEKALLQAFLNYGQAQALRQDNTNNMYGSGQTFANSIGFMAQFLLTGGIGEAAAAPVEKLANYLSKNILKKTASRAVASATKSGLYRVVASAATGAVRGAEAVAVPLAKTVPMAMIQTGVYKDYAQKLVETDKEGNFKYDWNSAMLPAIRDGGLEIWSEMALEPLLGFMGNALKGTGKAFNLEKYMKKADIFSDLWEIFKTPNEVTDVLRQAGFHGFLEEIGEEILGAGVSSMWDPEQWSEFWKGDNLISMIVAFAPTSIVGGGFSLHAYQNNKKKYNEMLPDIQAYLKRNGYSDEQISRYTSTDVNTLSDIGEKLKAVINPIIANKEKEMTAEDFKTIFDIARVTAENDINEALFERYQQELRSSTDAMVKSKLGNKNYISTDKKGNKTVNYFIKDGERWYAITNNVDGSGEVFTVKEDGSEWKFADPRTLALTTREYNDFLDEEYERENKKDEASRMAMYSDDVKARLNSVIKQGMAIPLAGETVMFDHWEGNNAIVMDQNAQLIAVPMQNVTSALGINLRDYTDEEINRKKQYNIAEAEASVKIANQECKDVILGDGSHIVRYYTEVDTDGNPRMYVVKMKGGNTTVEEVKKADIDAMLDTVRSTRGTLSNEEIAKANEQKVQAEKDAQRVEMERAVSAYTDPAGNVNEEDFITNDLPNYLTWSDQVNGEEYTDNSLQANIESVQKAMEKTDKSMRSEANMTAKADMAKEYQSLAERLSALQAEWDKRHPDESAKGALTAEKAREKVAELSAQGLSSDEIGQLAENSIAEAEKAISALEVPQISTDIKAYKKAKQQYDEAVRKEQSRIAYWNSILDAPLDASVQAVSDLQTIADKVVGQGKAIVVSADNYEEVMRANQVDEGEIGEVRDMIALKEALASKGIAYTINGWNTNGNVYIFAEAGREYEPDEVKTTYQHENQHSRNALVDKNGLSAVHKIMLMPEFDKTDWGGIVARLSGSNAYRGKTIDVLIDEALAFAVERAGVERDIEAYLKSNGITDTNFINLINGIINGNNESLFGTERSVRSGRTTRGSITGNVSGEGEGSGTLEGQGYGSAEEGDRTLGGISTGTLEALANAGLFYEGGLLMDKDALALKHVTGYQTPWERNTDLDYTRFSLTTIKDWEKHYRTLAEFEEHVATVLTSFAERMAVDELVNNVVSHGEHKPTVFKDGVRPKGKAAGPLRTNIEYIVTFDMDTSCPRTFQYLNYARAVEKKIGRPMNQVECVQLIELMRAYGQQIPCVYCYAENKRQALKEYYNRYIESRYAVMTAPTDEEALKFMYGRKSNKDAQASNDPAVALTEAAQKVFAQWREERGSAYNPKMKTLYREFTMSRDSILTVLDQLKASGSISNLDSDTKISGKLAQELRIIDPKAVAVAEEIIAEWKFDDIEGRPHTDFTEVDEDDLYVHQQAFALWREMTNYAKSATSARSVEKYVPYTDELKYLSQEDRDYINGMGGLRMHSTNDFRIDYVLDYFQFMADMAANDMKGHTYTKSPEFVKIFGNSGYKINMSIAAYEDENGIRPNADEGFDWDEAKRLRAAFPNAGVMLMATSDKQIQMALDEEWIDMFIPWHSSGLPNFIKDMRMWTDYQARQNEAYYNSDEMKAELDKRGVKYPGNISKEKLEDLFIKECNITVITNDEGKRKRPHFLPGPTVVEGHDVPGHNNDLETYLNLCRQYGVHPRFYGTKVKHPDGRIVDISEHPNYMKCIKETSRTDSPQTSIMFNFDQPNNAVKELTGYDTPMDYAFAELESRAMAEMESAGQPVKDIYKSQEKDDWGVVPKFLEEVIGKEKDGKPLPIDFIPPSVYDSEIWTEREKYRKEFADLEQLPYTPMRKYDAEGNLTEEALKWMKANGQLKEKKKPAKKAKTTRMSITPAVRAEMDQIEAEARVNGTYMKAPNGADTKLNEEQWLLVRTKNFKDWFGDWEKLAEISVGLNVATSVEEAMDMIRHIANKTLQNKVLGIDATISNNSIGKYGSEKATKKSVNSRLHAMAIANIKTLFETAQFEITHPDTKNRESVVQTHRLGNMFYDAETATVVPVMLTVIEFKRESNRIYSIEAIDLGLEKEKSAGQLVAQNENDSLERTPIADFNANIEKILEEYNSISRVVDENGEPMVVYHGTRLERLYFKEGRPYTEWIDRFHEFYDGKGFFTPTRAAARSFSRGEYGMYDTFLNMRNPLVVDAQNAPYYDITSYNGKHWDTDSIVYDAKTSGQYDGVVIKNVTRENDGRVDYAIDDYIPFNANQVKSSSDNNGEYSRSNNDIRFSVTAEQERMNSFSEKIWSNGFDSINLQELNNLIDGVKDGTIQFDRFGQEVPAGLQEGGRCLIGASIICRGCNSAVPYEPRSYSSALAIDSEDQQFLVEEWAKEANLWIDDTHAYLSNKYPYLDRGTESYVYYDEKNQQVYKANNIDHYETLQRLLDKIAIYNTMFPALALEVVNFGRNEWNSFEVIYTQPFVKGKAKVDRSKLAEDLEKYYELKPVAGELDAYYNESIYVSDLHADNVIYIGELPIIIDADIKLNTPEMKKGGSFIIPETGMDTLPGREVEMDEADNATESGILFSISAKRKENMKAQIHNKLTAMTDEQLNETIDEIERLGELAKMGGDSRFENILVDWVKKGMVILPQDSERCILAYGYMKRFNTKPESIDNLVDYIEKVSAIAEQRDAEKKPVNPDTIPELTNRTVVSEAHGIVVYDVPDSREGQRIVRNIVDSHWGKSANPWCLITRFDDGDTLDQAWRYWNNYNMAGRKIAFQNGKLIAFMSSSSSAEQWWDRLDRSHGKVPIMVKFSSDGTRVTAQTRVMSGDSDLVEYDNVYTVNQGNVEETYDATGNIVDTRYTTERDGKKESVTISYTRMGGRLHNPVEQVRGDGFTSAAEVVVDRSFHRKQISDSGVVFDFTYNTDNQGNIYVGLVKVDNNGKTMAWAPSDKYEFSREGTFTTQATSAEKREFLDELERVWTIPGPSVRVGKYEEGDAILNYKTDTNEWESINFYLDPSNINGQKVEVVDAGSLGEEGYAVAAPGGLRVAVVDREGNFVKGSKEVYDTYESYIKRIPGIIARGNGYKPRFAEGVHATKRAGIETIRQAIADANSKVLTPARKAERLAEAVNPIIAKYNDSLARLKAGQQTESNSVDTTGIPADKVAKYTELHDIVVEWIENWSDEIDNKLTDFLNENVEGEGWYSNELQFFDYEEKLPGFQQMYPRLCEALRLNDAADYSEYWERMGTADGYTYLIDSADEFGDDQFANRLRELREAYIEEDDPRALDETNELVQSKIKEILKAEKYGDVTEESAPAFTDTHKKLLALASAENYNEVGELVGSDMESFLNSLANEDTLARMVGELLESDYYSESMTVADGAEDIAGKDELLDWMEQNYPSVFEMFNNKVEAYNEANALLNDENADRDEAWDNYVQACVDLMSACKQAARDIMESYQDSILTSSASQPKASTEIDNFVIKMANTTAVESQDLWDEFSNANPNLTEHFTDPYQYLVSLKENPDVAPGTKMLAQIIDSVMGVEEDAYSSEEAVAFFKDVTDEVGADTLREEYPVLEEFLNELDSFVNEVDLDSAEAIPRAYDVIQAARAVMPKLANAIKNSGKTLTQDQSDATDLLEWFIKNNNNVDAAGEARQRMEDFYADHKHLYEGIEDANEELIVPSDASIGYYPHAILNMALNNSNASDRLKAAFQLFDHYAFTDYDNPYEAGADEMSMWLWEPENEWLREIDGLGELADEFHNAWSNWNEEDMENDVYADIASRLFNKGNEVALKLIEEERSAGVKPSVNTHEIEARAVSQVSRIKNLFDPRLDEIIDAHRDAPEGFIDELNEHLADIEKNGFAKASMTRFSVTEGDTRFSVRTKPAPTNTKTGYAVLLLHKDDSLHPKMIKGDSLGVPVKTWLDAETGKLKRDKDGNVVQNKSGRAQVKENLAWRPGKHLAEYPNASQFESKNNPGYMEDNVVFFEVEYAADVDYQTEAWEYGMTKNGKYDHTQAGLPFIPEDGYYKYRTNAMRDIPPMIITGAYKINRALTDAEARQLNEAAGGKWLERLNGTVIDEQWLKDHNLTEEGMAARQQSFPYDQMPEKNDESAEASALPGYVRREINWDDPNLQYAARENGQNLDDYRNGYEFSDKQTRFSIVDTTKATIKEDPIKLNSLDGFKLRSAFSGIKDGTKQLQYVSARVYGTYGSTSVNVDSFGPHVTINVPVRETESWSMDSTAFPDGKYVIEKDGVMYLDPTTIKPQLEEALAKVKDILDDRATRFSVHDDRRENESAVDFANRVARDFQMAYKFFAPVAVYSQRRKGLMGNYDSRLKKINIFAQEDVMSYRTVEMQHFHENLHALLDSLGLNEDPSFFENFIQQSINAGHILESKVKSLYADYAEEYDEEDLAEELFVRLQTLLLVDGTVKVGYEAMGDDIKPILDNIYSALKYDKDREYEQRVVRGGTPSGLQGEQMPDKPSGGSRFSIRGNDTRNRIQRSGVEYLVEQIASTSLRDVLGEEDYEIVIERAVKHMPESIKARVDAGESMENVLGDIAGKTELTEDEAKALEVMPGRLSSGLSGRSYMENDLMDLSVNDARWILYSAVHAKDTDIFQIAHNYEVQRNLGFADSYVIGEKKIEEFLKAAEEAKDDILTQYTAMRQITNAMTSIGDAMAKRREYDQETVNSVVRLARMLIESKMYSNLSNGEVKRLISAINNATGRRNIQPVVDKLYSILLDNQLKRVRATFTKLLSVREEKVNNNGVTVQGKMDVEGQRLFKTFKSYLDADLSQIETALADTAALLVSDSEDVARNAELDFVALSLAKEYRQNIIESKNEEKNLRREYDEAEANYKAGKMDKKQWRDYRKEFARLLNENKSQRLANWIALSQKILDLSSASRFHAQQFAYAEKMRVASIYNDADADMEGTEDKSQRTDSKFDRFLNSGVVRFFLAPLNTMDQIFRMLGRHSVNGEGYLWNRYIRGWVDATGNEFRSLQEAYAILDAKVSEVFGRKMKWSDLYSVERTMPTASVRISDGSQMVEHQIPQGNLLYLLMVDKMSDGRIKLRNMGITEDDIDAIRQQMDPRFLELAEWIQNEFLPSRRTIYNATYKRMFGASMASIDNYFPIRINKNSRRIDVDVASAQNEAANPSTITGNIIRRTRNALPIDVLNSDAFSVVIEHIQQMEHWNAFAEWNRDLGTLLSYGQFRNQVRNTRSVYGAGDTLWNNLKDACFVAAGEYKPKGRTEVDNAAMRMAKGVTAAKISLRVFTALKQFLSFPAYFAEANPLYIARSLSNPFKAWNWSMDNLPVFEKRWKSRQAGDHILSTTEDWRSRVVEEAARFGMSPNAFVDALTVSMGAYAIYQTKYDRYIKDGYSKEEADKRAKQDAVVLYNETQQSNENVFMSPMQSDRSVATAALTVFRNSSMGYQRQDFDAVRNVVRRMKPGYKKESLEFMTNQFKADGLNERQAGIAAERAYHRQEFKDLMRIAVFGWKLPFIWYMGSHIMYLLFGDDDDKKKEFLVEDAVHALFGSVEGLTGGSIMSEIGNMVANGESFRNYDPTLLPLVSDIKNLISAFGRDKVAASNDALNLLVQMGIGVNPQTITDMAVAAYDASHGHLPTMREALILAMRVLQVPQSQIEQIYLDEIEMSVKDAKSLTVPELARRYADYKVKRGAALTMWAYSDEAEEEAIGKYVDTFMSKVKDRLSTGLVDKRFQELADEASATEERVKTLRATGTPEADDELLSIFGGETYGRSKRVLDDVKEINAKLKAAIETDDVDTMSRLFDEVDRMKMSMAEDYDNDTEAFYKDQFVQYTEGFLPQMAKIAKRYKDEYTEKDPEFLKKEKEYNDFRDKVAEEKAARKEKIDSLKKENESMPRNGKNRILRAYAKKHADNNKEIKALQHENGEQDKKLSEMRKALKTETDYIPADVYNSPEFQAYLKAKELGSVSGNTFEFKSIKRIDERMEKETLPEKIESLQRERDIEVAKMAQKVTRFLNGLE